MAELKFEACACAVEVGLLCDGIAAFDPFLIQFARKVGRGAIDHALHQVAVAGRVEKPVSLIDT